jgi:hypothetical protein
MRVAILSRQTLHTEVMGLFIPVLHELGHTISLFYNTMDPWHMIDYYLARYPYIEETGPWRAVFQSPHDAYDRIVLITSDEWNLNRIRRRIHEWNNAGKLIVVHHDPCYLQQYPDFRRYVGLMPYYGPEHTVFPLYDKPALKQFCTSNNFFLPPLFCVGSLDSKDQCDVGKYIDVGGKVVNYVRYPATALVDKHGPERFECVSNLSGGELMRALTGRIGCGRGHMWFPIKQDTSYATVKFSGSLTLGADLDAVLVMPEILRRSLGLPSEAAITYKETVTESDTLTALRESVRDPRPWLSALYAWKCEQWRNTMHIVAALM